MFGLYYKKLSKKKKQVTLFTMFMNHFSAMFRSVIK